MLQKDEMKFEFLPNDILIRCFQYLDGVDLLYSFDELNHRFTKLIRTIPLKLDFRSIPKLKFITFCTFLSENQTIKHQISSLQLSNEIFHDQIEKFLSWFSLTEFPHLQRLSLIAIDEYDVQEFKTALPLFPRLLSFRLINSSQIGEHLLSILPLSKLRQLSILQSIDNVKFTLQSSTITYLNLSQCNINILYDLLKHMSLLKYLTIENLCKNYSSSTKQKISQEISPLNYLKQIIFNQFEYSFNDFESFSSFTPNLQSLTLVKHYDIEMIDAKRWQRLITSTLSKLINFHFLFSTHLVDDINKKFEQFRSRFWRRDHRWLVDYGSNEIASIIHTIPYIFDRYVLHSYPIQYQLDNLNRFDRIRYLSLYNGFNRDQYLYYFSNLNSFEWHREHLNEDDLTIERDLKYLSRIINFFQLEHLTMYNNSTDDINLILLEIFKQAPRLYSLSLGLVNWKNLFQNKELCQCLNRRIRILNGQHYKLSRTDDVEEFCRIFSHIEQFKCRVTKRKHLLYLLNNLSYLAVLKVIVLKSNHRQSLFRWLKKKPELDVAFLVQEIASSNQDEEICIWLDRNIDKTMI